MSYELNGNYSLNATSIDAHVTQTSPGGYALGRKLNADGSMPVDYVGRADYDLNARLKQHANEGTYKYFAYVYCASVTAAYQKECEMYHGFTPPDNKVHPAKPHQTLRCPVCGI